MVSFMAIEPEIEHEVIVFVLLVGEGSVVMVLAVIVTEGHQDWSVREELREELLNLRMSYL